MARSRSYALLAIVVALAGLAMPAQAQTTHVIEIRDDVFVPRMLSIATGDRVTWTDRGRNTHNVISDDGSFASVTLQAGDSFSLAFPKPGAFPYYCSFHGARGGRGQSGVILVGQGDADAYRRSDLYGITSATRSYPALAPERPAGGRTIRVPSEASTIQAAVDRARPGDMVLIAPGAHHEAVIVTTPHLTIRGEDRDRVILDGRFDTQMRNGIAVFGADGVAIENLTVRGYQQNGIYWRSVWGYRASYVTAYNNGDYGIYAFDSGAGRFDHAYASGHPDSGFYIGQCDPCNAVVEHVIARDNAIGYSGTNAGGRLVIRDSEWTDNMAGIVPSTLDSEALAPQRDVTIVRNVVTRNGNRDAPVKDRLFALFGNGIVLLGGNRNVVAHNLVEDHPHAGILVAPSLDERLWVAGGNRVHDNVVRGSGLADLALAAPVAGGNCFESNDAATTLPPALGLAGCGSAFAGLGGGDVGLFLNGIGQYARGLSGPTGGDWRTRPAPPPQPSMPDVSAALEPAGPAEPIDPAAEVSKGGRPAGPEGTTPSRALAADGPGLTLGNALFLAHGYLLPLLFLVSLLATAGRRPVRWLPRGRRALLLLAGTYVVVAALVFALAYVR